MKPETTLKEFLKPPFTHDTIGTIYDDLRRLFDVPGLNFNEDDPENWQMEIVETFTISAQNKNQAKKKALELFQKKYGSHFDSVKVALQSGKTNKNRRQNND